jgi:hypothetical protein
MDKYLRAYAQMRVVEEAVDRIASAEYASVYFLNTTY